MTTKKEYIKQLIHVITKEREKVELRFPPSFFEDYSIVIDYLKERMKSKNDIPTWEYIQKEYGFQDVETCLSAQDIVSSLERIFIKEEFTKTLEKFKDNVSNEEMLSSVVNKMSSALSLFSKENLFDLDENIDCVHDKIDDFFDTPIIQYYTGFKQLDEVLMYGPGTINYIVGGTGGGKSLTLNRIFCNCIRQNIDVSFLSLEMPLMQCINRMLTDFKFAAYRDFKKRTVTKDKTKNWLKEIRESHKCKIRFLTREAANDRMGVALIEDHIKKFRPSVFFLDYLQLLDDKISWDAEVNVAARLKAIALQYNCCFVIAVQANSDAVKDGRIPRLGDIAIDSGMNRDCDSLLALRGSQYTPPDSYGDSQTILLDLALRKNRDGDLVEFHYVVSPDVGDWMDATNLVKQNTKGG